MANQTVLQVGQPGPNLFAYFHIYAPAVAARVKETTGDTAIAELWGNGTSSYRSVIAGYGGWANYVAGLARRVGLDRFQKECLTTWSAGSQVIKTVCRGARLPHAIVSLDGLYGTKPPGSRPGDGAVLMDAELTAVAKYALAAARGERIFVLLHSAISTPYGSSGECADAIRAYVEREMGKPMEVDATLTPADLDKHAFSEALVLGNFHLVSFPGVDAKEHIAEAHLYDEVWTRWIPWMTPAGPAAPAGGPVSPPAPKEPVLRAGSTGPEVKAWQNFVRGQNLGEWAGRVIANGAFDDPTVRATKELQRHWGLKDDGEVGPMTRGAARQRGYDFTTPPARPLPPPPAFQPLQGTIARQNLFGRFDFAPSPEPGNPEAIRILGTWERDHIVRVQIPELAGVRGAPADCRIELHKKVAAQFQRFFAAVAKAGLLDRILTFDGSFVPRFIRGSRTSLSNHAFGTAIDLNAAYAPLGSAPKPAGSPGSLAELVPYMTAEGLFWGGFFTPRPDPMHVEAAYIGK